LQAKLSEFGAKIVIKTQGDIGVDWVGEKQDFASRRLPLPRLWWKQRARHERAEDQHKDGDEREHQYPPDEPTHAARPAGIRRFIKLHGMDALSIGKIKPMFDPLDLVGKPVQPQAHSCHAFCICCLVASKTGKPHLDARQTTALLKQDLAHVAHIRTNGSQMFKNQIVHVFSHGVTLTLERQSLHQMPAPTITSRQQKE
jgi:hypothetical protein